MRERMIWLHKLTRREQELQLPGREAGTERAEEQACGLVEVSRAKSKIKKRSKCFAELHHWGKGMGKVK